MSSPTTKAPLAIFNVEDNYNSSDEAYIEPAEAITADHSALCCKKMLHVYLHYEPHSLGPVDIQLVYEDMP
jgi:hypothetical protein